ncbi:MAG: YesL family protein [Eubacterium sp.]|nr:YesL family protein [Eubacterium sp.]
MKLFRYDSGFMQMLDKATDFMLLNILCFLFSLPIITAGASVSAKYNVAMKIHRKEEPTIIKPFFKAFKENLPMGIGLSLVCEITGTSFFINWLMIYNSENGKVPPIVLLGFIVITLLFVMIVFCLFPFFARYSLRFLELLKSATFFTIANLGWILIGVIIEGVTYWYCYQNIKWCWLIWLMAKSFSLYLFSGFFSKKFEKLEEDEECEESDKAENAEDSGNMEELEELKKFENL